MSGQECSRTEAPPATARRARPAPIPARRLAPVMTTLQAWHGHHAHSTVPSTAAQSVIKAVHRSA